MCERSALYKGKKNEVQEVYKICLRSSSWSVEEVRFEPTTISLQTLSS